MDELRTKSGRVLSESEISELVAEAERGYEVGPCTELMTRSRWLGVSTVPYLHYCGMPGLGGPIPPEGTDTAAQRESRWAAIRCATHMPATRPGA